MKDTLDTNFAHVEYIKEDNIVLLKWHKQAYLNDFKIPTLHCLNLLTKYSNAKYVVDVKEVTKAELLWATSYLLPNMAATTCKSITYVLSKINTKAHELYSLIEESKKYFKVKTSTNLEVALSL